MPLNKQKGNMYDFVNYTFNSIKGRCWHGCSYCWVKKWYSFERPQPLIHLDEQELRTDLGKDNFIFVGSSCDMWAHQIPEEWIDKTLAHCREYPDNKYLFQSKNPARFYRYKNDFPPKIVLATTIETNRHYREMGQTPTPTYRAIAMSLYKSFAFSVETMITIEPIMDFDLEEMVDLIKIAKPDWINIGADSKGHDLPEPSKEKLEDLIESLSGMVTIKKKSNLARLMMRPLKESR